VKQGREVEDSDKSGQERTTGASLRRLDRGSRFRSYSALINALIRCIRRLPWHVIKYLVVCIYNDILII